MLVKPLALLAMEIPAAALPNCFQFLMLRFWPMIKINMVLANNHIKEANLDQICRYADVISFHVPLTDETLYMANEDFFNSLQQKPFIINTSRGSVVQTSALINALQQNQDCRCSTGCVGK